MDEAVNIDRRRGTEAGLRLETGARNPYTLRRYVTHVDIQRAVAKYYGCTQDDLKSLWRTRPMVGWRQIAMYLIRKHTPASCSAIGRYFGGRDHATVLHSIALVERRLASEELLRAQVVEIENIFLVGGE